MDRLNGRNSILAALLGRTGTFYNEELPYPSPQEAAQAVEDGIHYGKQADHFTTGGASRLYKGIPLDRLVGQSVGSVMEQPAGTATDIPLPVRNPARKDVAAETPRDQSVSDIYNTGTTAATRSALATLGMNDLSRFAIDPEAKRINLGGAYNQKKDQAYVNTALDDGSVGQALPHEAMHRGMQLLRKDPRTRDAIAALLKGYTEEDVVRAMNQAFIGKTAIGGHDTTGYRGYLLKSNEDGTGPQKEGGVYTPGEPHRDEKGGQLSPAIAIEQLAARILAENKPRGPR